MNLSERQRRMLDEMGIAIWPSGPWSERDAASGPAPGAATGDVISEAPAAPPRAPTAAPGFAPAAPAASPAAHAPPAPPQQTSAAPPPFKPAPHDERAIRIAALEWPALQAAVAACTACGLSGTRTQTVFGVGHLEARWMVVGEAPGEQEDRLGEPFVGAAGQLLDSMLRALGLTRSAEGAESPEQRVYIVNTLKCRPPRNRNPEISEMQACEPFLLRQIALVRPKLILAMGRFAIQALLRTEEPVGRLRGRIHTYQGVPLVVTYHPAYLLRNLPDKAKAWDDLCLAARVAES